MAVGGSEGAVENIWRQRTVNMGEAAGPRRNGVSFYIGNRQETFDAETSAIVRGIHSLASRRQEVHDFKISTDSQAVMTRIQSDASGPCPDMANEVSGLEDLRTGQHSDDSVGA